MSSVDKNQTVAQAAESVQAGVQDDLITLRKPTTSAELLWLLKLAHLVISDVDKTLEKTFAPAQPAAQHGVAYADAARAALAAGQATAAQAVAEPADTVVLNAAMRAIQQAIELIGAPTDERMRAVRRVLRGAVIVAEDAGKVAPLPGTAYAELPEYGINTASHAHFRVLGFTADQMRAFADATHTLRASHGEAPAQTAEPVAWAFKYDDGTWHDPSTTEHSSGMRPLLAAPQPVAREPLTPERLREIERMCVYANTATLIDFARAIERAHGIGGGQHAE